MPFKSLDELPEEVKSLPAESRRTYVMAYNMAWEQYKKLKRTSKEGAVEAMINEIALAAVKHTHSRYGGPLRKP
jgi:cation transport regulator ChaB